MGFGSVFSSGLKRRQSKYDLARFAAGDDPESCNPASNGTPAIPPGTTQSIKQFPSSSSMTGYVIIQPQHARLVWNRQGYQVVTTAPDVAPLNLVPGSYRQPQLPGSSSGHVYPGRPADHPAHVQWLVAGHPTSIPQARPSTSVLTPAEPPRATAPPNLPSAPRPRLVPLPQ